MLERVSDVCEMLVGDPMTRTCQKNPSFPIRPALIPSPNVLRNIFVRDPEKSSISGCSVRPHRHESYRLFDDVCVGLFKARFSPPEGAAKLDESVDQRSHEALNVVVAA